MIDYPPDSRGTTNQLLAEIAKYLSESTNHTNFYLKSISESLEQIATTLERMRRNRE